MAGYPPEADLVGSAERLCRSDTQFGTETRPEDREESPAPLGPRGSGGVRPSTEGGLCPPKARGVAQATGKAKAHRCSGQMAQARRFGASSDIAFRRKDGASHLEVRRSRRDGSDAVAPGEAGPPPRVTPGLGKPGELSRGASRVYRKTSMIGGENRAIQDRRRATITKVNGRPIRGDLGYSADTVTVAGNGTAYTMPKTRATTNIAPETEHVFSSLPPVPGCAGTAAQKTRKGRDCVL